MDFGLAPSLYKLMSEQSKRESLIAILQLAYSGELAAGYAYRGHWHSVRDQEQRLRIQEIENEEWHHRNLVAEMLRSLHARPNSFREIRARIIGRGLGLLCHVVGWLAPMYGAGKLESRNIREYETAARLARDVGKQEFVDCLLTMAEVEWEHEKYFRERVISHRWAGKLTLWQMPPDKDTIRRSFAEETWKSSSAQVQEGAGSVPRFEIKAGESFYKTITGGAPFRD